MEATEEEEYDRWDGANPQRRLDDALLSSLADGILLRSIVVTTAGATATVLGSTATMMMLMPAINVVRFNGREDWEGNNGNSVATEDNNNGTADAEAGEYVCNFLDVGLHQL